VNNPVDLLQQKLGTRIEFIQGMKTRKTRNISAKLLILDPTKTMNMDPDKSLIEKIRQFNITNFKFLPEIYETRPDLRYSQFQENHNHNQKKKHIISGDPKTLPKPGTAEK
jgi:hypothetical protein